MAESFIDSLYKNGLKNPDAQHSPDVLSCLANLSNDEVFTPPEVVNRMLDMLPQELFSDPNTKFLDPACKTGVFLREIAKRLLIGLQDQIPVLQERIDHIFKHQLYGIAITELTSLLSRRSVYCSKYPNGQYSVCKFDDSEGNIRFKKIQHTWVGKQCKYCGASKEEYNRKSELETYAYEFIHMLNPEEVYKMKFDVIISNVPYQLSDGGAQASAKPIYHLFVEQAKKLEPRYMSMIIPSRWMTGGKGLDKFRHNMIHDKQISILHDYADSKECFTGVDIKGGVCYFLWEKGSNKPCDCYRHTTDGISHSQRYLVENDDDIFIRQTELVGIKNKVQKLKENTFDTIVSARKPYGLEAETMVNAKKFGLPPFSDKPMTRGYKVLGLMENKRRGWKYIPHNYPIPKKNPALDKYKVFIAEAYGCGEIGEVPSTPVLSTPVLSTPGELCTETFLEIGPFNTKNEAANVIKYIHTKFFRALVGIQKQTQHTTAKVYRFVPLLDFTKKSDINWDLSVEKIDKYLYKKYKLDNDEIVFIENNIQSMED